MTDLVDARRAHDHGRLRRAAGRRRHADRVDHGRVHRARARAPRAGGTRARSPTTCSTDSVAAVSRRHRRRRGASGPLLRGGRRGRRRLQRRDDRLRRRSSRSRGRPRASRSRARDLDALLDLAAVGDRGAHEVPARGARRLRSDAVPRTPRDRLAQRPQAPRDRHGSAPTGRCAWLTVEDHDGAVARRRGDRATTYLENALAEGARGRGGARRSRRRRRLRDRGRRARRQAGPALGAVRRRGRDRRTQPPGADRRPWPASPGRAAARGTAASRRSPGPTAASSHAEGVCEGLLVAKRRGDAAGSATTRSSCPWAGTRRWPSSRPSRRTGSATAGRAFRALRAQLEGPEAPA